MAASKLARVFSGNRDEALGALIQERRYTYTMFNLPHDDPSNLIFFPISVLEM